MNHLLSALSQLGANVSQDGSDLCHLPLQKMGLSCSLGSTGLVNFEVFNNPK